MVIQILLQPIIKKITENRLFLLIVILFVVGIISVTGMWLFEHGKNDQFKSLGDYFWWWIVTSTTVGYGDKYPITTGGRFVGAFTMIAAIGSLGLTIGASTEQFLNSIERRRKGMNKVKIKGHTIICGYTRSTEEVIKQLMSDPKTQKSPIVLIADAEENPFPEDVLFVKGNRSEDAVLEKANIKDASLVILLGIPGTEDSDGRNILATLSIKRLNPKVEIAVDLVNVENAVYLKEAGVKSIVCGTDMTSRLLTHGDVLELVQELVSNDQGIDASKTTIPNRYVDKPFKELWVDFKEKKNAIVVGIERGGKLIGNPKMSFVLKSGDKLLVIADDPLNDEEDSN